ncbi:MAG: hypothetical protein ACJAVN_002362 [Roseivirga sp.]|jgi:hypothetical protein
MLPIHTGIQQVSFIYYSKTFLNDSKAIIRRISVYLETNAHCILKTTVCLVSVVLKPSRPLQQRQYHCP